MRTEAWEYHDGRGPNLARWRAARQSGSNLPGAIRTCRQTLDRDDCPPSPARRLLVTDLRRYQRLLVQQERRTLLDPANPSGRAALSRIQPARPNRSLFGLDDLVGSELSRDSAHPTTRG